jgi:hypothetical protein
MASICSFNPNPNLSHTHNLRTRPTCRAPHRYTKPDLLACLLQIVRRLLDLLDYSKLIPNKRMVWYTQLRCPLPTATGQYKATLRLLTSSLSLKRHSSRLRRASMPSHPPRVHTANNNTRLPTCRIHPKVNNSRSRLRNRLYLSNRAAGGSWPGIPCLRTERKDREHQDLRPTSHPTQISGPRQILAYRPPGLWARDKDSPPMVSDSAIRLRVRWDHTPITAATTTATTTTPTTVERRLVRRRSMARHVCGPPLQAASLLHPSVRLHLAPLM